MIDAKKVVRCGDFVAQPDKLIEVAKGQVYLHHIIIKEFHTN